MTSRRTLHTSASLRIVQKAQLRKVHKELSEQIPVVFDSDDRIETTWRYIKVDEEEFSGGRKDLLKKVGKENAPPS